MNVLGWVKNSNALGPPYAFFDVCHTHDCPATHVGKKYGPCNCGGAELKAKFEEILANAEARVFLADHTLCGCKELSKREKIEHNNSIFGKRDHTCPNPIVVKVERYEQPNNS